MKKEDFEAVLAEAEMTADELTESFRELTVEDFEGLEAPAQEMMAALFELSEEDLSETELGKFFSEDVEEEEEVSINESIIQNALSGNIVDTQKDFDAALRTRIDEKIDAIRADERERLFEAAEPVEESEDAFTFADVMAENNLDLDAMIQIAENMTDDEFAELNEDNQNIAAVFNRIYEDAEGDRETIEAAINVTLS